MKSPSLIAAMMISAASILTIGTPLAASQGPVGEWLIADGTADVAIRPCGANLCGFVSWSKNAASTVGAEVLIDMKPEGDLWSGIVVNAVDGQKYDARMSLLSDSVLKIQGCVLGGIFCGDQQWSRVK